MLSNKLKELVDKLVILFSTDTFVGPALKSELVFAGVWQRYAHDIEFVIEKILVVSPDVKRNGKNSGRVDASDESNIIISRYPLFNFGNRHTCI